jgi:hypothetical protein
MTHSEPDTGDVVDPNAADPTPEPVTDPEHPDYVEPATDATAPDDDAEGRGNG